MKNLELKKESENNPINYADNCFDIIRIIAALQVMIGHLIEHFELDNNYPFLKLLSVLSTYIPGKGVVIFFVVSGFFSFPSLEKVCCTNGGGYWKKKFLRIYPELWLAFIINTIIIAVLYGLSCNYVDNIIYFITQITIFQFYTGNWLREYGVGTPNGALWTITVTIQFYIIVFFLFKLTKKWKKINWGILLFCCILLSIVCSNLFFVPDLIRKLIQVSLLPYLYIFIIGIVSYKYRNKVIPFLVKWFWLLGIIYLPVKYFILHIKVPLQFGMLYDVFSTLLLSATIIGAGYAFGKKRLKYEISYSIFIWHMIICNVCIEISKKNGLPLNYYGIWFMCITIILTLIISIVSSLFGKSVIKYFEKK